MNRRIFMPGLGEYVTIKPVAPIDVLLESKCTKVSIQVATVRETKVDCFVKTRKFDLIDIIAEALKFVVSLPN